MTPHPLLYVFNRESKLQRQRDCKCLILLLYNIKANNVKRVPRLVKQTPVTQARHKSPLRVSKRWLDDLEQECLFLTFTAFRVTVM